MQRTLVMVFVGLAVAGCAAGMTSDPRGRRRNHQMAVGKTWQWVATVTPVERITVVEPARYTILLRTDGKAQIRFDCNRGGGDYTIADGRFAFGPLMSTRMACPPDSQDAPFMRDLGRVSSFFLKDGHLFLAFPADSGSMRFRQGP